MWLESSLYISDDNISNNDLKEFFSPISGLNLGKSFTDMKMVLPKLKEATSTIDKLLLIAEIFINNLNI